MSTCRDPMVCVQSLRARAIEALVIGASAGGVEALCQLVPALAEAPFPVVVVLHLPADSRSLVPELLGARTRLRAKEAEPWEPLAAGVLYLAPPGYHLSIEADRSFALSTEEPVHFSRPSIDVLFDSAAGVYRHALLGVLLTGANADGAAGLARIQQAGGFTLVEDPATAKVPEMPLAALRLRAPDALLSLSDMTRTFTALWGRKHPAQSEWRET
jgi:two-component system chemotaxis response regulator CheB